MEVLRKRSYLVLFVIVLVGVFLRFYGFTNPIADWHSWRQADTSSVSRIYAQKGIDLLHPRFHDLSNVPSGKDNPEGYRFVEFPLYNLFQAGFFKTVGIFTLEEWGRLVTIIASAFSIVFLYGIVSRHADKSVALGSAFFFAVLPYNIYYGRVVLPDPLMVTATLAGIYFFDLWIGNNSRESGHKKQYDLKITFYFFSALLCVAAALLLKPFAIFFFLPLLVRTYQKYGMGLLKQWRLYVLVIFAVTPLLFWRWWMLQYPEGIPVNDWLFNGGNIRFKGAFFYWVFADHIGKQILGYVGYGLFLLGVLAASSVLFVKQKKESVFFLSFVLATLLYLFVVARGNVQHDYYQIPIVPTISIFLGFGASFLFRPLPQLSRIGSYGVLLFFVIFSLFFSWYHIRDLFNINNPNMVIAGAMVDKLIPNDATVITFYDGDTSFLYQTKRSGWASMQQSLPEMITLGAEYVAIVNPTENDFEGLGTEYPIIASDPKYLILKLK